MTRRPKSFSEAIVPMEILNAIIGYGVFQYPTGRRHYIFSIIYTIIVTFLNGLAIGFTLKLCYQSPWYDYVSKIFFYIFYTNVFIAGLGQIISWYHTKRLSDFIKRLTKIDRTLQELGAEFDNNWLFKWGIGIIAAWPLIVCILNATDFLWLHKYMPIRELLIVSIVTHHPMHMNSIVVINFSIGVGILRQRYRKVNELLERIIKPVREPVKANNKAWQYFGNTIAISAATFTISTRQIMKNIAYRKSVIQTIKQVHLELEKMSQELNRAFGVQVALQITAYFVMFTGLLLDVYNVAVDPSLDEKVIRILVQLIWCTTYFSNIMIMNVICESISREARRTGNILHCITETFSDNELYDEIKQFSLQIIQNPLYFRPAELFTLGYEFVQEFLGAVTTYLVILIQMSGDKTQK